MNNTKINNLINKIHNINKNILLTAQKY